MKRTLLALLACLGLVVGVAAVASADPRHDHGDPRDRAVGYYLALGDSLAAGYQPGLGDDKTGGYVGGTYAAIRADQPRTQLVNLACSGETVVTLVAGGMCDFSRGSQLAQAVSFLRAHGRTTRTITLDIGANDVQPCVNRTTLVIDTVCIQAGLGHIAATLPTVVKKLRTLAPHATIVVLNYYNPFLAAWLLGPTGQVVAEQSTALQAQLNTVIATAVGTRARVADVATSFRSTDQTPVSVPGLGTLPTNVATICTLTWMCGKLDIHANDQGYALMAHTVVARLGRR